MHSFLACELRGCKGLGPKFYTLVKEFTENQSGYRDLYNSFLAAKESMKGDISHGTSKKMDVNDISDPVPGLHITGTITNRTRRYVSTRNNMNTEIVT